MVAALTGASAMPLQGAEREEHQQAPTQILFTNVNIFDGKSDKLTESMSVLVEGNKIKKIAKSITAPEGATVIDAKGRTLTPGFIATHEHIMGQMPFGDIFTRHPLLRVCRYPDR